MEKQHVLALLLQQVELCWALLAASCGAETEACEIVETLAFGELCRQRGLNPGPSLAKLGAEAQSALHKISARLADKSLWMADESRRPEVLGHIHQHLLGRQWKPSATRSIFPTSSASKARKAAGVFYTPESLRDYVVERALQSVTHGKPLAILDPACGSGWFLLTASRYLRSMGLGNVHIAQQLYGVDIDAQAVLAAQRALWLELATGNTNDNAALAQTLADRVRCGNMLTDQEFDQPQFDVIIGNPPYRRELGARALLESLANSSLGQKYRAPRMDLWYYFVHRGLELLRPGGRMSLVVGSYWTAGQGAEKLIDQLRQSAHIEEIVSLDRGGFFPRVAGRQMILTVCKSLPTAPTIIKRTESLSLGSWEIFEKQPSQLFRAGRIDLEPPCDESLLACFDRWPPLGELGEIRQGIAENPATVTRRAQQQHNGPWLIGEGVFTLTAQELANLRLPVEEQKLLRPYHDLCDLGRYRIAQEPSRTLIYTTAETCPNIEQFPALCAHLKRFRPILEARRETQRGCRAWWQLHWPRADRLWQSPKLIVVQMAARPAAVAMQQPIYVPFSTNVFVPRADLPEDLNYLAALLNSRLLWTWYRHHAKRRGVGIEINGNVLARTPIRRIDFSNPADIAQHLRLVELATAMARTPDPSIDAEIDVMVAGLYEQ